jgi:hypothetical protein
VSCLDLKKKALTIFGLLLIFAIVGPIAVATAQDTLYPLLTLSSNELTFYAKENGDRSQISLTLVGLAAGDGVNVRIVAAKLYDNSSEEVISNIEISDTVFDLKQNNNKTVTVTLDPSVIKAGTYEGVLIITATNKTSSAEILTTNIKITAKIEGAAFWYKSEYIQIMFVVGAIAPIFAGLLWPDKDTPRYLSKRFWIVVFGAISVSFWLVSIISLSFKEPGTIINTVLVTPFLTYVISFVKDKRTERLELEKASRDIRAKGIENDINLIRAIMGETATHCASFKPHLYKPVEKQTQKPTNPPPKQTTDFDEFRKILFIESGVLNRKVWAESCKQGQVADLPLLELEQYYDFLDTYNRNYSRAIKLTKDNKPSQVELKDFNFEIFDGFRKAYAELETVVFVYLSYILGHLTKAYLSPLKVEYRRISRTLLLRLVKYGILKPEDYKKQLECFIAYHGKDTDYQSYLEARKKELDKKDFTATENETETLRYIIKKWHFDADDIEEIYEEIYKREKIPRIYRKIADDFEDKYVLLKNIAAGLPPITDELEEPEKKHIEMSGQLVVLKGKK